MSRDCCYLLHWEPGAHYATDLMEQTQAACERGSCGGVFLQLGPQTAFFTCSKGGLVLTAADFAYPPDQMLESANGDPFVPYRL